MTMGVRRACVLMFLVGFIPATLQTGLDDPCVIQTLVIGSPKEVSVNDNCSDGTINWDYPDGSLMVTFPRSVLPELSDPTMAKYAMKVCIMGDVNDLKGINQIVTTRKGRKFEVKVEKANITSAWVCGRPSRSAEGVVFHFVAPDVKYYVKMFSYKVESCKRFCGWRKEKGKDRNGRRGRNKLAGKRHRGRKSRKRGMKGDKTEGRKMKRGPRGKYRAGRRNKVDTDDVIGQM